jgi:hypothetical protein|tara:strand:+ start:785 stop:1390 length:606 start_codon:yes stop_codon:yes gene_type:complete
MIINEIIQIKEDVGSITVFYGGRFQPMHQGHRDVYKHLVTKFGADNVFIATTFSQKATKAHAAGNYGDDPFTFDEKKSIMSTMFSIPADKIINSNPYRSEPSTVGRDNNTTGVVLVFGAKDAGRLGGSANVQQLPDDISTIKPQSEMIYFYEAPLMQGGMSASDFRAAMASDASLEAKQQQFTKFFGKFDQKIFSFIEDRL